MDKAVGMLVWEIAPRRKAHDRLGTGMRMPCTGGMTVRLTRRGTIRMKW
jgi:hypothetical protein